MRKAVVACACVGLSVSAVCAADFYWTGAANDQMATNRLNWADADGQPVAAAPTHEDTVIFNLTTSDKTVYKYSNRTDYEYRKLILRGKKKLTFYGYGDCPTNMNQYIDSKGKAQGYAFYLPIEVVNESDGGTLLFSGKDPRVDRGSPEHYATNVFHVANANATIQNSNHIQTGDAYHKVIKTGPGKLIPYGGHNYDVRNFTIQEGTIAFSTHAQRSWWNCGLVFLGDAPNKVFDFQHKAVSGTYKAEDGVTRGTEYWSKYVLRVPLKEENVTTTSHELRSSNGADLVFTNSVTDMSFTGRIRGSLNFHWAPDDATKVFTYSKGESDTTGQLNVIRGRMEMRDGAHFTALSKLTVGEAAVLDLAAGTAIIAQEAVIGDTALEPGFYVNAGSEGQGQLTGSGVLLVGGAPLTVPYVDATKTATPFDFTGSDVTAANLAGLMSLPVALSESMAIGNSSMHVTNRLAVSRFAATSGVTAALFEDVTTKSYGLPTTWFESETANDVTTIYLVAKPVISAVMYQGTSDITYYYTGDANFWSDGQLPHAGADYCNLFNQKESTSSGLYFRDANVSGSTKVTTVFGGDSLTVGHSLLYLSSHMFACDLRAYNRDEGNYSLLSAQGPAQSPQHLAGRLYADPSNKPLALKPYASTVKPFGTHGDVFVVDSDIYGSGDVKCVYTWSTSTLAEMALHGNNGGLTGQMELKGGVQNDVANKKQYWQQFEMAITNANALGGPMPAEAKTGFKMSFFPLLKVNATTTYETENRLWYAENGVRLQVTDGCAFALKKDYRCRTTQTETLNLFIPQRCAVEKTGAGDFLLGGRIIPVDSDFAETAVDGTNNLVRVCEGGVGPLTADAFDLCQLVFSNGTSIVAEKGNAATADYGLRLRDLAPVFVDGAKVTLRPVVSGVVDGLSFTQAFLTVPAATPDLRQTLVPGKVRIDGKVWSGKLLQDTVTIGGRDYTRYSALYEPKGTLILVR